MNLEQRIARLEAKLNIIEPQESSLITDVKNGEDGAYIAYLPLGDLRITESGVMVVHPHSSASYDHYRNTFSLMGVDKVNGLLRVSFFFAYEGSSYQR